MADLLQVLPDFDPRPYAHLLPSVDKALVTTNDLVTLEPAEVAKRARLPPREVRKFTDAVVAALHCDLGFGGEEDEQPRRHDGFLLAASSESQSGHAADRTLSTLDSELDAALLGGIRPGYLVEVTGESGAGKTQLLLTLLLSVQLAPPHGLSKTAIYISTEAALATNRLVQLLSTHPQLTALPPSQKPSLSRILSIQTPDLESQDHILRYQLPVAIKKHNVGLVVLDSVAANFRAEFEKPGASKGVAAMARRTAQLMQLGALLRGIARREGIAVVVANQVADRFSNPPPNNAQSNASSRTASTGDDRTKSMPPPPPSASPSQKEIEMEFSPGLLELDHQQSWFTGWGDVRTDATHTLKTPSLGLVWTNQIACRIALHKQAVLASRPLVVTVDGEDQFNDEESHISKWRRWFKVVFSPWAPASGGRGVEYEVAESGMRHVGRGG